MIDTEYLTFNQQGILRASDLIRKGGVVVFPTDTVYGIGVAYDNEQALQKLFEIKGRDNNKPVALLCSCSNAARDLYQKQYEDIFTSYADLFFPGPLTLVVPAKEELSDYILSEQKEVGIRIPNSALCLKLIDKCGGIVAATSANISTKQTLNSFKEIKKVFHGSVDAIICCDFMIKGVSSTVVRITPQLQVLREGSVSTETLKRAFS